MIRAPQTGRNKADFLLFLRLRLKDMTPRERAALKRQKAMIRAYPIAIEHRYARDISETLKTLVGFSIERLTPILMNYPARLDSWNLDSPADDLVTYLRDLDEEIENLLAAGLTAGQVLSYVGYTAARIMQYNTDVWKSQIMAVLGSPLDTDVSWWPDTRRLWEQENQRLIKSLSQEYVKKLNSLLVEAFQSGTPFTEVVDQIRKLADGMTGYRARLIARDQVGKLQYAITRNQFESIGMDGYIWTSARDERVRGNPLGRYPKAIPSHWEIDGKICKFSDPTVYSEDTGITWLKRYASMPLVHPGQAIMCRCIATPYWLPLIREAERLAS